ncbi:uncharacterized protein LOC118677627 [Myotis myotis]|uniref:uncharacterized protein LOC118677627 n=1 Tax=Myotis myotis TaxID=51298 RepID=UPI00174AA164|nr:uncharacterized protein LOC118677627 [Myotis myotis]
MAAGEEQCCTGDARGWGERQGPRCPCPLPTGPSFPRCSGPFDWEATPGTNSSDVTCSSRVPVIIISGRVILVILVIAVISVPRVLRAIRDRRSRGELAFPVELLSVRTLAGTGEPAERNRRRDLQASRVQPDVTTEPVEETASLFPQRDRHLTHGCGIQVPEPSPRSCWQWPGPQRRHMWSGGCGPHSWRPARTWLRRRPPAAVGALVWEAIRCLHYQRSVTKDPGALENLEPWQGPELCTNCLVQTVEAQAIS